MIRNLRSIAAFAALLIIVSSCAKPEPKPDAPPPKTTLTVGAVLPLTGKAAQFGQWAREGMDSAIAEVAESGAGLPVKIAYEDSQNDAKLAVNAASKLINVDKVDALIVLTSSDTLAVIPAVNAAHVVTFTGTLLPDITSKGDLLFRNASSLRDEVDTMSAHLASLPKRPRVGVLFVNNDAGKWSSDFFGRAYPVAGGTVVASEGYNPTTTDFRPHLGRVLSQKPDVLYLLSYGEFAQIMRQARERKFRGSFAGITTMEDATALKNAGAAAEGAIFTKAEFNAAKAPAAAADFVRRYQQKYGRPPELYAASMRDAIHLLSMAGKNATPPRGEALKNALLSLPPFEGASGTTKFERNRDVRKRVVIKRIVNGTPRDLE